MPALLSHILVPSLDSLYVQDNRLPNVGADYSRIAGPPRHLWTWQEKMILYILTASYRNPSPDLMKVFNLYFSTRSPGFLMPRQSAWMTMAAFITNPARYRVWWGESTTQQLKDELERLASTTDIELQPAVRNTAQATINRRRRLVSPSTTSTSSSGDQWELDRSDITDDEAHGIPRTPRAPNVNFANGLLTPPPTSSHRARTGPAPIARAIPPIAFRGETRERPQH